MTPNAPGGTAALTPNSAAGRHQRALRTALLLTSVYLVAEVAGGLLTGSLALLADAGHMLTDVAGLGLALVAVHFGGREPTPERTYGYYRIEILAAAVNAVLLIGISAFILVEAYRRFRNPPEVASGWMLIVAVVGLGVNLLSMHVLKSGSADSLNLRGAYFEVISDMLGSAGVIIAAVVIRTTGWLAADPAVSAAIGLFILPRTWRLLSEAVGVLLEGTPRDVDLLVLRSSLSQVKGVSDVHDLHVWALTSGVNAMSVHVVAPDGDDRDTVIARVRQCARERKIAHVTVQVETVGCARQETHL